MVVNPLRMKTLRVTAGVQMKNPRVQAMIMWVRHQVRQSMQILMSFWRKLQQELIEDQFWWIKLLILRLLSIQPLWLMSTVHQVRFYMAPEYATRGYLTPKADVYGFGIVALEIVSGNKRLHGALMLKGRDLLKMVDKDLGSDYSSEKALTVLNVAVLCLEVSAIRPTMSQTCNMLEGKLNINDFRRSMRPPLDQPIDISLLWPDYKRNDTENRRLDEYSIRFHRFLCHGGFYY
ncbi:putative protein kinase RLK-Pelle-LRR-IV family [Helianthus annuus]|nr:putative protein kinase RLK-Pelle-LRR-IV family [Helianthus annuus]